MDKPMGPGLTIVVASIEESPQSHQSLVLSFGLEKGRTCLI